MAKHEPLWREYLIQALKEDLNSREAEISAIRASLRYRVGGWVLEAWPPRFRSIVVLARIVVTFLRLRRNVNTSKVTHSNSQVVVGMESRSADTVVFGTQIPEVLKGEDIVCSDDLSILIAILDSDRPAGTLVLRLASPAITRRIQRLRFKGWNVFWWPEKRDVCTDTAQQNYIASHSDEYRSEQGT